MTDTPAMQAARRIFRPTNDQAVEQVAAMIQALTSSKHWLQQLQPALNVMARECLADIIADHIDPAIAIADGEVL